MEAMLFHAYTIGDWQTEKMVGKAGELDRLFRMHTLTFLVPKNHLRESIFLPLSTVNDRQFLDIDPEHLFCESADVSVGCPVKEDGTPEQIAKESQRLRYWVVKYVLLEQSGWQWNKFPFPVVGGRCEMRRLPANIGDPFNMNEFFGADGISNEPETKETNDQEPG